MLQPSGKALSYYRELASLPVPAAAHFFNANVVLAGFITRDHLRNLRRSTFTAIPTSPTSTTVSFNVSDAVAWASSPSGTSVAILREQVDQTVPGGKKRYVELWRNKHLETSLEVTGKHGPFYDDEFLSTLTFSPSETALLYTAEANDPTPSTNSDEGDTDDFERFRFKPSFGESFPGKKMPTLYLLYWNNSKDIHNPSKAEDALQPSVTALSFSQPPLLPTYLAQAVFASENQIIATGYEYSSEGRLLGVKYCCNRPAGLWELVVPRDTDFTTSLGDVTPCAATKLTPSYLSGRSPRVFPHGSAIVWLSNKIGGPHASCSSLHTLDIQSKESRTLVDTVWEPGPNQFPGLYVDYALPSNPFLLLSSVTYVIAHSIWHSRSTVLLISCLDGNVKDITPDDDGKLYSWIVLNTDGKNQVICSRSSLTSQHEMVLGRFDDSGSVEWKVIDRPDGVTSAFADSLGKLQASIVSIPERFPTETIVLRYKVTPRSPLPCVTVPHGGPHSTSTTSFSAAIVALALQGYTVALPNYTGSLGFGEKFVRKLLGNCGTLDVHDCMASVRHLIELGVSEEGAGKQFVQGGSHGGFLAAHLISQFPDVFSAAIIRNPVISVGEISTSDIPDWYFEEFGVPFGPTALITPDIFEKLHAMSPISRVDAVRTPVLLLVGDEDKRVAPTQAINYYHALKGRGKVVEVLCFPKDSHPLDNVETAKVVWGAGLAWLDRFSNAVNPVSV